MKTAVSVPDAVFEAAEELASELGLSRSALYATALAQYIAVRRAHDATERLDAIYSAEPATLDEALLDAQLASVADEGW